MRLALTWAATAMLLLILPYSCRKAASTDNSNTVISPEVLDKIHKLGLGNQHVTRHPEGYLAEGDIVVTEEQLNQSASNQYLRTGQTEHYRTSNLVTGLPRVISVRLSTALPTSYITATNAALARFNALGLQLTFTRVTTGGNILIAPAPAGSTYNASAGYPSSAGNPYSSILVNRTILDTWATNTVTTIIAHELGHCIGFLHTDVQDPTFSCGPDYNVPPPINLGIWIYGTPTGGVLGSWMLTCISNGVNRPFVSSDILALNYLY